jgi:hypothetical protein
MPSYVQWRSSDALQRRLQEIQDAARPGSKAVSAARKDIRTIIIEDHHDKMLRGADRYGKPRAALNNGNPLKPWQIKARGGSGPSLVPRGPNSRFYTNIEATWVTVSGYLQLVMRFRDILSKAGKPFAQYHLTGSPSTNLPKRDVGGTTPKGWNRVIKRHKQLGTDIIKAGGGR